MSPLAPLLVGIRFVVGLNDGGSFLLLPRLVSALRVRAPEAGLNVVNVGARDAVDKLLSGEIELACGVYQDLPPSIESRKVATVESLCVAYAACAQRRRK